MKQSLTYFLIAVTILFSSCENSQEEINALNKKTLMVDQATRVEAYLSQGGKAKAKLTAPLMLRVTADTSYTEFPKTLHVDFYNDIKMVDTRLDAKYGKYYESLNKVYLRDSVKIVTVRGDTLYCDDLWWDQNKELFYTNKPARLRRPLGQKYNGKDGLEATQDLKRVSFKNGDGIYVPEPGDMPGR